MTASQLLAAEKLPGGAVFLLTGNDDFLRELVLTRLRQQLLDKDFAEFNHSVVRCSANTKSTVVADALFELPMMTDRRLLELRSAQSLPPKVIESLHRDFTRAVESKAVAVVISLESEPGAKGGPRKADFPWVEGLNPAAVVVQCSLDDKEVPAWIRQRAQDLGLTLAGNAAQVLQERVGRDLRLLDSHIQKLRLFQGKGAQSVGVAEVEALVPMSVEVQTWRLTAAIGSKDVKAAYTVLDHLLAQGENPGSILSYVNSYMLSLAELKDLKQRLGSLPAIAAAMPKKSEYQIKKNLEDAATWSDQQLRSGFERLMRADFRIKTGSDALLMLQLTLLQLCSRAGR